jgi:hypothetical protein
MSKGGVKSGEHRGVEIFHHSVSSSVRVVKTYTREVKQGVAGIVVEEDWYDYSEIKDLFEALKQASKVNLKWLLKK